MTFSELLNEYIERLGCTAKELSDSSGLSAAVISRYRTGDRAPAPGSEQVASLARGICALSAGSETVVTVCAALNAALGKAAGPEAENLSDNLGALMETLNISPGELARALNYDASYISRVRTGQRRPADPDAFCRGVGQYVVKHFRRESDTALLAGLLGCTAGEISRPDACADAIGLWLCTGTAQKTDDVGHFLEKLDDFDLNAYIRSIHFDELKVPSLPLSLPISRNYYGLAEMRRGELNFFKTTVLSHASEPVFMCSDMPMDDMAEDQEFPKKWMFGLAVILKKGLHINMVHYLDRPFHEMMLGLESWIPLYMTGQVSPYYLKNPQNAVYNHFNYVSGAAALTGDCIAGGHREGKYYLTNKKDELAFFTKKAALLLQKAQPLMNIYRAENKSLFEAFLNAENAKPGSFRSILSVPPIYTLDEGTLLAILRRNGLDEAEIRTVTDYAAAERERMERLLGSHTVADTLCALSPEEFAAYPPSLSLTGAFYEKDILYTYEEYTLHLRQTEQFAAAHPNYSVKTNLERAFRNIQITMKEGEWVLLSKNQSPTIHFVVRHPKLRAAIENMVLPVVEQESVRKE